MRQRSFVLFMTALALFFCSCARVGDYAQKRADKAAYEIIAAKQTEALGKASRISIDPGRDEITERILAEAKRLDFSKDEYTTPTHTVSLNDALTIAIANNPDYKNRRESLYTQALGLTEVRRDYGPLFSGSVSAGATRTEQGEDVEWYGSRGFSAGVSQALATGARVSLDFSHSFIRFFTNDPRPGASNSLSATITQPLLRGAGTLVAREGLRQAERGMIYEVRSFRRYQQEFIITAVSRYFELISAQDQLRNARSNYESTVGNFKKLQKFAEGGLVSGIEVDQGRQRVLQAETAMSGTRRSYGRQLDNFKIFLGLPIDLDLGPDPQELARIAERGLMQPRMDLSQAVAIAMEERLDLKNMKDSVWDSERQLKIAMQNFLPHLDAGYEFSTSTGDDKDRVRLDFEDHAQQFSLNLGLPFDWTPRRNDYRRAQISLEQTRRSLNLFQEQLVLEVREAWRELEEARVDYRIQLESVKLAKRRVEMASLFLKSGRATARDLLEAEDELWASQNALTSALVRHTIQRLQFWNAIERLEVDEKGMWIEQMDEQSKKSGEKTE